VRERGRDVVTTARDDLANTHDLARRRGLARSCEAVLLRHTWPRNVRELRNLLFRAVLLARGPTITATELAAVLGAPPALSAFEPLTARLLAPVEQMTQLSAAQVADAHAFSHATANRVLKALVATGDVEAVGSSRVTRHRRTVDRPILDDREGRANALVSADGRVTRSMLARAARCPDPTAVRVLARLVARGLLVPDGGRGSASGYPPSETRRIGRDDHGTATSVLRSSGH